MTNLYWVNVDWFDDFEEENRNNTGILLAESYNEAIDIIDSYFGEDISKLSIELLIFDNGRFINLPNDEELKEVLKDVESY